MSKNITTNIAGSITSNIFGITGSSTISSVTSGTNLVGVSSTYTLSSSLKTTYHVLGEDVEVSASNYYKDLTLVTNIATLNVLGKPFLEELHKNGVFFPTEIEEYLEKKFKWLERDKKIDDIIN